jgi:divalent metal cation (Fe/Co/Zn/Cd) transporter
MSKAAMVVSTDALALYVVIAAGVGLWRRRGAEFSTPGIVLALAAIPVMYVLSRRKLAVAEQLGSRALRADAIESITCGWLSVRRRPRLGRPTSLGSLVGRFAGLARRRLLPNQRGTRSMGRRRVLRLILGSISRKVSLVV